MQNVTPMLTHKNAGDQDEPSWSFPGGAIGFASYWFALALPFLLYGANVLFFFLYTWPFFLALLPVSVLIGMVISFLLRGKIFWMAVITAISVICLFWMLFTFLTGW
ncbi:hypothetical protein BL250_08010 [Erwinia sp. OLTSP20]|uniref:DUF3561 family protein n=1 Tax=unclassified Erwinia TaxID=2622719 RepID=UPI000C1839DE|nr:MULTISPECIES: DUF3561 family protein [unclassified Erwinia]PIJ50487.1 hypothetical protein BV501_08220 [Erwinia sp. OAMSP11]PIJ72581.1 hypothetical protein BK416_08820 [Erwinia sp. OLSSP12]PIJ82061.1 hypothetical protein BLD47_06945 [Erwinia sp. OLCASP19]PIJ84944.1 hypothetical protein BLD46_06790 [Erwinia sp. OLMTSP26]PIJ86548.1 hypothetical protein BLD49_08065 [Erwinia sp. OLMDSP33]